MRRGSWKQYIVGISILGVIVAGVLIYLCFKYEIELQILSGVTSGLITGLIIIFMTIFGIDRLQAYRENNRWEKARHAVLKQLNRILNVLIANSGKCLDIEKDIEGMDYDDLKGFSGEEFRDEAESRIFNFYENYLREKENDIKNRVKKWNQEQWADYIIRKNYPEVVELARIMASFPAITSEPKLINAIVEVEEAFNAMNMNRLLGIDILGVPIEKQPKRKEGIDIKSSSESFHYLAASGVVDFMRSVVDAKKIISELQR